MIIIPLGIDCGISEFIRSKGLRKYALPFDWLVSYQGCASCIDNDFVGFIPNFENKMNAYGMFFYHDFETNTRSNDEAKYNRRVDRFKNILQTTTDEVVFIRKGHAFHHHNESREKHIELKNDITDSEELDEILSKKYTHLKYRIIVTLVCGQCFDPNVQYTSKTTNVNIYNLATPVVDNQLFATAINKIINDINV